MEVCDQSGDGRNGCCCAIGFETNDKDDCLSCNSSEATFVVPTKCLAAMGIGAGASVVAAPIVLATAGFSAAGVTAGSLAATWQSTMGAIGARGVFASLQSAAMGGLGMSASATLAGAAGTSALAFCKAVDKMCNGCIGEM